MSQSYLKECIFCKSKIRMSDEKGKWRPFNIEDNTEHDCKNKNGDEKLTNGHNEISLELVLKETCDSRNYFRPGEVKKCLIKIRTIVKVVGNGCKVWICVRSVDV